MEKLYKVEIARTPKSIVDAIRFFELEFGETYLEGNDIFDDSREVMEFAYKSGHLPKSRYENWKADWNGNVFHIDETFQVIFGSDEEYEPFCITFEDENSEEDYDTQYEKALLVYGELVCSKDEYFDRFVEEFSSGEGNLGYVEVVKVVCNGIKEAPMTSLLKRIEARMLDPELNASFNREVSKKREIAEEGK